MHDSILFTALWNLLCTAFCAEGDYRSADSVLYNSVLHDISGDRRIYHAASGILHRADHTVPFPENIPGVWRHALPYIIVA